MMLKVALVFVASAPTSASKMLRRAPRAASEAGCADFLSRWDCQEQKDYANEGGPHAPDGYCYIFAEECAETCGCDFDQPAAREEAGLDDAHYASEDFQCVDGDAFQDSHRFNCTLYEGARWCEVGADGFAAEGPGWCHWFDPPEDSCHIARGDRWPPHAVYANEEGQWAKSCCCNSGLADTYPYEEGGECVDLLDSQGRRWTDPYGYSCRAYHFGSFCTLDGGIGHGWDVEAYGEALTYIHEGLNPLMACCTCGGADFGIWFASERGDI